MESFRQVGGVLFLLATIQCAVPDCAMRIVYAATLADGETFTTLDLQINFLEPAWDAKLRAVGRVVGPGRRMIGLVECDVLDERRGLAARASSACMTPRGERARDR